LISVQGAPIISGSQCRIRSTHSRNWITPYGPYVPQSGAWWDCKKWPVSYTAAQHRIAQRQHFRKNGVQV
jgi:hypothetical protein